MVYTYLYVFPTPNREFKRTVALGRKTAISPISYEDNSIQIIKTGIKLLSDGPQT